MSQLFKLFKNPQIGQHLHNSALYFLYVHIINEIQLKNAQQS